MTYIQHAQFAWPDGKQGAVSLTYDDGLPSHHQNVAPALEARGLRGTFYTVIRSDVRENPDAWRTLAERGHELGNHSLFHPCQRAPRNADWLDESYNLYTYSERRFREEIEMANAFLHLIDGQTERSYGNTCHVTTIGQGESAMPMDDILAELVVAGRGPRNDQVIRPQEGCNLMALGTFGADYRPFSELKPEIEQAVAQGGWIIYTLHGVGAEAHRHHIDPAEHDQLITWLGQQADRIWTAPVVDVARYIRNY